MRGRTPSLGDDQISPKRQDPDDIGAQRHRVFVQRDVGMARSRHPLAKQPTRVGVHDFTLAVEAGDF
jgi:hypothetical protein